LTVVGLDGNRFTVDVSPETLTKTTFHRRRSGDSVNLERALRLSDRLDGHLVSGHIDGVGTLSRKKALGNAIIMSFKVGESLSHYIVQKGSVAVDGVSLTINRCDRNSFEVSIIPHTATETHITRLREGDPVNIETDMIGKYVERFVSHRGRNASEAISDRSSIDLKLLAKNGFL
jgi:riboflavin synthase